jgi:hypothetical protein
MSKRKAEWVPWYRKRKAEWVPWYRERNYKGDLTEAEKRQLDAFRMQAKHPAADYGDLPEEVLAYICELQVDVYRKKQDDEAERSVWLTVLAGAMLFLNYKSSFSFPAPDIWWNLLAVAIVAYALLSYRYRWRKNADEFGPKDNFGRPTEEGIRENWEAKYIADQRQEKSNQGDT